MSLKKQFAVTLASVGLGAALIGGGTFAYFSDQEAISNSFAAGTLDLAVDPTVVFDITDMKPGDFGNRWYEIANNGTLDIQNVYLTTDYTVTDAGNDNGAEDFGDYLRVNVKYNWDNGEVVVFNKTLAELKAMTGSSRPDLIEAYFSATGHHLPPGDVDSIFVQMEFVDNGADQNHFQGDSAQVTWTLDATQTAGEAK